MMTLKGTKAERHERQPSYKGLTPLDVFLLPNPTPVPVYTISIDASS
jgi:hypothetical protein